MKSVFDTRGGDSKWNSRTGETAEIIRPLGPDEADIGDVGPMFKIRFQDGAETDAFLDELPDLVRYRFGECVFDITTAACQIMNEELPDSRRLGDIDSRDLYSSIAGWAAEFEENHLDEGSYMSEIEEFAAKKLKEYFELEGEK